MWQHLSDKFYRSLYGIPCYLCGEKIEAGEKYCRRVGVDSGLLIETKMHLECEIITKKWSIEDWECHDRGEFERPTDFKTHIKGVINADTINGFIVI